MIDINDMAIPEFNPQKSNQPQQQTMPTGWPTDFPKPVVGIEKNNTITRGLSLDYLPNALEAIRMIRLKQYKLVLINDESGRQASDVDRQNTKMMEDFGSAGIQSIDTMYYSIGTEKQDIYKKPSTGMFKRCEKEWPNIKFAKGWYVGHTIFDAKAAFKMKSRPVLINPTDDTLKKLNSFSNQKIAKQTKIFSSLLEFANTLK